MQALVTRVVDALNERDWDGVLADLPPDFEYDLTRTASPLRGVYRRDQIRRVMDEFIGSWETVRYEPREFIAAGDSLVVPFTTYFRGRDGIEVQSEATWLWSFRGEALTRLVLFQERDEALAAAGAPAS